MMKYLLTTSALIVSASWSSLQAGQLIDLYDQSVEKDTTAESAKYLMKAAEQRITTEKRNYLPRVSSNAKLLWVEQNIDQENTTVFQQGHDAYSNTRASVTIDQPLIDFTVKPRIEAAEAMYASREYQFTQQTSLETKQLVQNYLDASEHYGLLKSYKRVIQNLEDELDKVSKSFEEKLATIEDVENVKAALAAMKNEKHTHEEQLKFKLMELGVSTDILAGGWVTMPDDANLEIESDIVQTSTSSVETRSLEAEITAFEKQISALKRKSLPKASLYGLYLHDDANGSEFGGSRRLSGYEVGLAVNWDIFDRGINYSEAKELYYLKRAKEADLHRLKAQKYKEYDVTKLTAELAEANVQNLQELVKHKKALHEASIRSFEAGGDTTYINKINAYLVYESQIRQFIIGKHRAVAYQATLLALSQGWSRSVVESVDLLYAQ